MYKYHSYFYLFFRTFTDVQPQQSVCSQQFKRLFFFNMEETISKESQSPGYLVSEFTGVRSKKSQTISIKQYLDKVRSDEFKEKVLRHRLLRQQPGHEAEAQAIKSKMPCIIPAGICQGGHAASQLVQLSLITSVDLDDTNERTDEIFESLKELPYLKVLAPQHFRYRPESISLYQHQQSRPIQSYLRRCVRRDQSICTTSLRQEVQRHHPPLFLLLGP